MQSNSCYPVFVDVDKDTMGLSPFTVEAWLSEFSHVKIIRAITRKRAERLKPVCRCILLDIGLIERIGADKSGYWKIMEEQ